MGIYATKRQFQARVEFVAQWLVARRVSANALTSSALVVSAMAGMKLAASARESLVLWLVPGLRLARLLLNVLDGQVARLSGSASKRGELFNEFADRVSDLLIFGGLAFATQLTLGFITISMILLSSYVDILGKSIVGRRTYRGVMAKGDRMIWLSLCAWWVAASGLVDSWLVCWLVLLLGALVTMAQRLKGVYDAC